LFTDGEAPVVTQGQKSRELNSAAYDGATAVLFIVEDVDPRFIMHLCTRCSRTRRPVDLKFIDDFLDTSKWFGFTDVEAQLPPLKSLEHHDQHAYFRFVGCREFVRQFVLTRERLHSAIAKRTGQVAGGMNPVPRREADGSMTLFPPIALTRNHITAWFDVDEDGRWHTGRLIVPDTDIVSRVCLIV
jgi:hypothetical protein